jgi:uncharacterized protein (DUF2062 family)
VAFPSGGEAAILLQGGEQAPVPRPKQTRSTPWPRLWRFLNWLIRLRGSPQAIARGIAIGMVVAFTPTIGFQMLIVLGIATLLNANRPVSIVPTWLTNPFTIPPVYAFTYYLGSFFWPGPELASVTRAMRAAAKELESLDFLALRAQVGVFLDLGLDVFMPMWIGGLIVGAIAAAIAYPLTLRTVVRLRERRARRRGKRRSRHRARRAAG